MPKSLFGTLHETGHALYEQFCDPAYTRTPLATDLVGSVCGGRGELRRPREPVPPLREPRRVGAGSSGSRTSGSCATPSRSSSQGIDAETFWRAVNRVEPGLIRVESDELDLRLPHHAAGGDRGGPDRRESQRADLPEAWNAKVKEYLGWRFRTTASECSRTSTGRRAGRDLLQLHHRQRDGGPALPLRHSETIGSGTGWPTADYLPLREWMTEHVHRHGRRYTRDQLLETGDRTGARPDFYIEHLTQKYSDIYGL